MRSSKPEKTIDQVYEELRDFLDLKGMIPCYLRGHKSITLLTCKTKCAKVCRPFYSLSFVTDMCEVEGCSENTPCYSCIAEMSSYKHLILALGRAIDEQDPKQKRRRRSLERGKKKSK